MSEDREKQIPCIVGLGLVTAKRDMIRVLRGYDHVKYEDIIDNQTVGSGEAYVVEVFISDTEGTLVFNRRIHLNVNNFDYLKIINSQPGKIELVDGYRILKLTAQSDPFDNKEQLMNEVMENRNNFDGYYEEEDIIFDDDF